MARRRGKKKGKGEEGGGEAWLLPYSDLMTLLLAVFIVLFAVSKMSQTKSNQMAAAFRNTLLVGGAGVLNNGGDAAIKISPNGNDSGVINGVATQTGESSTETGTEQQTAVGKESQSTAEPPGTESQVSPVTTSESQPIDAKTGLSEKEYQNMDALKKQLDALFQSEGLNAETTTSIDSRGLVIHLNNVILFNSGSADIKSESIGTLEKIATIINSLNNYIRIEGHTDNVPISSSTYPSNWELSAARATSVVRLFVSQSNVSPDKLVAVGYGEYKPIADNSTPEGKAKNRRIDIIVLSDKYNNLENQ